MSAKFYPKKAQFETKSQVAPNSLIFNHELTEPAKIFLLALNAIYTCTQNWVPIQTDIQKRLRWGQDRMENAIKSAVSAGYLKVIQTRNEKGLFNPNEFEFDIDGGYSKESIVEKEEKPPHNECEPMGGFPPTDNPPTDNPYIPCSKDLTMSKETTTCSAAVFFDCLEKIEIEQYEKAWLSKNYDEPVVKHAVAYATNPNTKIRTTLVQTIKWACEKKPGIPTSKEEDYLKNKELAENIKKVALVPNGCQFEVLNKHVEICFGGNTVPFVLEYIKSGFKEMLREALKKYNIHPNADHFPDAKKMI